MDGEPLGTIARDLGLAAEQARNWALEVRHNAARVASEAPSLVDTARRVEIAARRLERAAAQPMAVGVFGPSQSGKSYLVSRLCKAPPGSDGADERLIADFGGRHMDFLKEINPAGDKESTGLVTRFAIRPRQTPTAYPVALELLSETDLVRIFANSYLCDFDANRLELDPPAPGPDEVRELLGQLRQMPPGSVVAPHLTELAVFDLRDYFQRNFPRRSDWLAATDYWPFALENAGRLALAQRAQLFGVLWGGIPEFGDLYLRLTRALAQLDFAAEAFCALEALEPRERSIIDVDRIKLDLGTPEDDRSLVRVVAAGPGARRETTLPRGVLCALVAELRITLENRTYPLLEAVDVLDFPGARSREKYRNMRDKVEADKELARRPSELFIRGKVAVLFERYTEGLGLASMLLCMPGGNAEVKDLGHLLFEWIKTTFGETPAERARQRNSLFLVLTKSDLDFKTKEGEDDASRRNRWSRRIYASMLEPYGSEGWLDDWGGGAFANTLLLRNPGYEQSHLVAYQTERRDGREVLSDPLVETGYAPLIKGELGALRESFLADPRVTRHFRDAGRAFEALLALNDGGVTYIVEQVQAVSDPKIKLEQMRGRLLRQSQILIESFARFHDAGTAGSREERLKQAVAAMDVIGASLLPDNFGAFGRLLSRLAAQEGELHEIYLNVPHTAEAAVETRPKPQARSIFDDIGSDAADRASPSRLDPDEIFARRAIQSWVSRLRALVANGEIPLRGASEGDAFDFLVEQLIGGVHRLDLTAAIAGDIRSLTTVARGNLDRMASLAAGIAANRLNALVGTLGYGDVPEDQRPPVPPPPRQAVRRAFRPPEAFAVMPQLGDRPRPLAAEFVRDWMSSFVQLSLDNLGHAHEREITTAQNAALGSIIAQAQIERRLSLAREAPDA